jgi:twitching motility protein PilT
LDYSLTARNNQKQTMLMNEPRQREPEINKLFRLAMKLEASDFYLEAGSSPRVRLRGVIRHINTPPLVQEDLVRLVSPILYVEQLERMDRGEDIVFTYVIQEGHAYRVEVFHSGGGLRLMAHRLGTI